MKPLSLRSPVTVLMALTVVGIALAAGWFALRPDGLPPGFAASNGRIEAVEIDIAAKSAGRLLDVMVREGDFVATGQVLARMDTAVLDAQLKEANAGLRQAEIGIDTARSLVSQREAERAAAQAVIGQRQAELDVAAKRLTRTEDLAHSGTTSLQKRDDDRAEFLGAKAALSASQANLAAAEAALSHAKSQVIAAQAQVEATQATILRIHADIDDSTLRAPRDGRVQYQVAQPGEVLSAGGVILNLVDLSDVYMTFFLSTAQAGKVAIGAEVRIILDAAPQYVIPAHVTFVADVAQFTPKSVETAEERQKLTFRIKAAISPNLLRQHIRSVKTGLPGMAYVQLAPQTPWPAELQENVPHG